MVRNHQPGQAIFRSILPEDIDWKPFPAFPPSVRLAVVVGRPSEPGPYTIRVKVPSGVKLMPHRHPEDRVYTVISGVFYIGLGDQFDGDKAKAFPPGSVVVLPGNTAHFHWAKSGEYVTQVTAIARWALNTWILATIRVSKVTNNPTRLRFAGFEFEPLPGLHVHTTANECH
jgi:quercetin dioxygenase-like cupin family protein